MSGNGLRGQSSLEFFVTYGWELLVIAVVLAAFAVFISIPSNVVPHTCTFALQLSCKGVEVGSNSLATVINLEAVNSQQYDLYNPSMYVNISQYGSANAICVPSNVISGADILCSVVLPKPIPVSQQIKATMIINSTACLSGTFGNCVAQQGETYIGNFSTAVSQYTGNFPISISLYITTQRVRLGQSGTVVAHVKVLGQNATGAEVEFTTNAPTAHISPPSGLTDSYGNATGYFTGSSAGNVLVIANAFGIATASNTISVVYFAT